MDDYVPPVFDPFEQDEYNLDTLVFDHDTSTFYADNQPYPISEQLVSQVQPIIDSSLDPVPTVRPILQAQQDNIPKDDPTDLMPNDIFEVQPEGVVYFPDSTFFSPVIASFQQCLRKNITGYCLIPANFAARLRSRRGNHSKPTPAVFLPQELVPDAIRAKFE